jgi:imidazolonepropionase
MRLAGHSYADIAKSGGGILSTVKATRAATEAELLKASEKRLRAILREGVTTVEIKSGYGLELATEMKMLRVARQLELLHPVTVRTTFLGAHAVPPEFAKDADAYIDYLCNDMLPAVNAEHLADAVDGFCEKIAFSPKQIDKLFRAADKLGLPVKLHAEQLSNLNGAKLAASHHALSADHLEYASEAAIRAMAVSGTVAVLLPGAFYMLKETKKPPVKLLRKHNVRMALATDCNPGTSPITSILAILNMACLLFDLTPEEALLGVTRNGAAALGLGADIGTLEAGKNADIAVWDIGHPVELAASIGYNPLIGIIKQGKYEPRSHRQ